MRVGTEPEPEDPLRKQNNCKMVFSVDCYCGRCQVMTKNIRKFSTKRQQRSHHQRLRNSIHCQGPGTCGTCCNTVSITHLSTPNPRERPFCTETTGQDNSHPNVTRNFPNVTSKNTRIGPKTNPNVTKFPGFDKQTHRMCLASRT